MVSPLQRSIDQRDTTAPCDKKCQAASQEQEGIHLGCCTAGERAQDGVGDDGEVEEEDCLERRGGEEGRERGVCMMMSLGTGVRKWRGRIDRFVPS